MGVVVSSGKGRATKYKLAKNARVSIPANQTTGQAELLPLSKQGKEIQRLVSPPRQKRDPVSYNRSKRMGDREGQCRRDSERVEKLESCSHFETGFG